MKLLYLSLVGFLFSLSAKAQTINQYDKDGLKHGVWIKSDTSNCDQGYIHMGEPDSLHPVLDTIYILKCPSPCYRVNYKKENYTHGLLDGEAIYYDLGYCRDTTCKCSREIAGIELYNYYLTKQYSKGKLIAYKRFHVSDNNPNDSFISEQSYYINYASYAELSYDSGYLITEYIYPVDSFTEKINLDFLTTSKPYISKYEYDREGNITDYWKNREQNFFRVQTKFWGDSLYKNYHSIAFEDYNRIVTESMLNLETYKQDERFDEENFNYFSKEIKNPYEFYFLTSVTDYQFIKLLIAKELVSVIQVYDTLEYLQRPDYTSFILVDSLLPITYDVNAFDNKKINDYNFEYLSYSDEYDYYSWKYFFRYCTDPVVYSPINNLDSSLQSVDFITKKREYSEGRLNKESRLFTYLDFGKSKNHSVDSMFWNYIDISKDTIYMPVGSFDNILYSEITTYNKKGKVESLIKVKKEDGKYYRVTYNGRGRLILKEEIIITASPAIKLFKIDDSNYIELRRVGETE